MDPLLLTIIAILLPPVAVFIQKGAARDLAINIVLFILVPYIGGLIHALWLIWKKPA
jgi:uncharacterized membrane protein YqaE (UPF0057 family)